MLEALAQLLLHSNQENDITKLLQLFFHTVKQQLGMQSIGCYWVFNQEWYFSGELTSPLSKQMREMSIALFNNIHEAPKNFIITAQLPEHQSIGAFIGVYFHHELIGVLGCTAAHENTVFLNKKTELSLFAYQLANIFSHAKTHVNLKEHYHEITRGMIAMIESLDPYLRNHSKNVANYSLLLSKELKISPQETEDIYYAALFHDIGKIGIPLALLQKPGTLEKEEFEIIKQHPIKGAHILEQFSVFTSMVPMVLHHHEMWQGGGYPDGLKGNDIPFGARVIAVVDAYDALTTNRIYRKAQEEQHAIDVIRKNSPQQFDPEIVEAFIQVAKNL